MPVRRFTYRMAKRAHFRLGQKGERLAARLLRELDLQVIARNYAGPHGELDLIARDGDLLCFVEVKTRHHRKSAIPGGTLTPAKKQCIVRTARRYLRELGSPPLAYRFDLVELIFERGRLMTARHFPEAFREDDVVTTRSGLAAHRHR